MSNVQLSSLRVSADMDAGKYKAGADQKVAADAAMVASSRAVGEAIAQTDTKISASGNVVSLLSRKYVDGQKEAQAFERDLRGLNKQLETGKVSVEQAATILVGMNQKLGITADQSEIAARGQVQLAAAVGAANAQIQGQTAALARASAAHQAFIAQARADQQAENSRQSGAANQSRFNSLLGVQTTPSSGARSSASVFEAQFAQIEQMAQLRAQHAGALFADNFNSSLMMNSGKSARASASVFEEAGREADQMAAKVAALRAELNPLGAAQDRVNAELAEYSALAAKGAISAEELARAQNLARGRLAANQNGHGAGNFAAFNSGQQLQDIAVTASMGQGIGTIALQQGLQLGTAWQMSMGEKGATGVVKTLAGGITSLFSPLNLAAVGFTAVVAAGIQFGSKLLPQVKSVDDAIQAQKKSVTELGEAYGVTGLKADDFGKKSVIAAESAARRDTAALRLSAAAADKAALSQLTTFVTPGRSAGGFFGPTEPEFRAFDSAIQTLRKSGHDFAAFEQFERSVTGVVANNPGLQTAGDKILGIVAAATEAAKQLQKTNEIIKDINRGSVGGPAAMDRAQQAGRDELERRRRIGTDPFATIRIDPAADQAGIAQRREAAAAQLQSLVAKSPAEKEAAARAEAAAQYVKGESEVARADRIDLAGKIALAQSTNALSEAQKERGRSLENTLASGKFDIDLIGKTTAQVEALQMAFQLEQQVRDEAARNNVAVDQAELAAIKAKAAEYGKLRALQQARDTIFTQSQDIDLQRAELGLIGQNTLAHDRAIASFKAEQQIRQLGIPLYGAEAVAIRKNTAELAAMAEASAKAKLAQDLMFERDQLGRTSQEQDIASRLRGAGLPVDLNSPEAQRMRSNQVFSDNKEMATGFLNDFKSELLNSGGNIGKALGTSILNALTHSMDKQWEAIFDRLGTAFANWMSGGKGAGGALGAGSSIVGAALGGANDNYAPGAVTRAPLGAIGGSMAQYAAAIRSIESAGSGGYSALGPVLKNGNQALGAYQVMKSNLPSWSQDALGKTLSPSQFLADSGAQDAIFAKQFGKYLSKYGNPQDAASAWFTGRPLSSGAGATDVLGTTGSVYVDKFNAAVDKAAGSLGGLDSSVTNTVQALAGGIGGKGGLASILDGLKPSNFQANTTLSDILGYSGGGAAAPSGGGSGFLSSIFSFIPKLFGFADGTESAPEGWAWVGERGPELRRLRAGDTIRSNARSMQMASAGNSNRQPNVELHVHVNGASGDDHIRTLSKQGAQEAIGEYHQGQVNGGFGDTQRRYTSQKG